LEWEYQLNDAVTITDRMYHTRLDWLSVGTIFNGVFPSETSLAEVNRAQLRLDDDQRFSGNQFEVNVNFSTGWVDHRLLGGLELVRQKDRFALDVGFLPGIDLFNPIEYSTGDFFPIPGQSQAGDFTTDVIAPYVVDHITFGPKCNVFVGARYDSIEFDDGLTGFQTDFTHFSPMFGFLWSFTENQSVYGNVGEAFAPPSTLVVSQDRKPEESSQVEVGWKKLWLNGNITTTVAAFQLEKENIAISDDNGITKQTGTQESQGIELELAANLDHGLHIYWSYSYTDAELTEFTESLVFVLEGVPFVQVFDRSGNTPSFAPEHLANLWVGKDFNNGLGLAGGLRYVDDQFIAEDNAFAIDSHLTVDAVVSYDRHGWRVSGNVRNLTDEAYHTRGFGATSVIPADPTSFSGEVEFRF